jgi:hypothetical protein
MTKELFTNNVFLDEEKGTYTSNTTSGSGFASYQWDQPKDKTFYYFEITLKKATNGKSPNFCFGYQTPSSKWKTKQQVGQHHAGVGWFYFFKKI